MSIEKSSLKPYIPSHTSNYLNHTYVYTAKRTKKKDFLMWTLVYGGGFVVELLIHIIWNAICAATKFPHGPQAWMATQRLRKEHKDKAWDAYRESGSILVGFITLLGGNAEITNSERNCNHEK